MSLKSQWPRGYCQTGPAARELECHVVKPRLPPLALTTATTAVAVLIKPHAAVRLN